ncbi:MAG: hypothetical protein COA50_00205 [Flavobacteriaceae bacterium]|nr:MAG: hypothetical protein COA50_00205 [Flavobacteriaceae bacterium]
MQYKYSLDKSSKKFNCPNCNKKTFVYYIDIETGNYLAEVYGRCDRESKCGYFKSPSFQKPLSKIHYSSEAKQPSYLSENLIGKYCNGYDNNNFINFLLKHFSEEEVIQAIEKYYIGTSSHWKGATIFFQIDCHLRICTGKIMLYDGNTGKRVKKPFPHINWLHKLLNVKQFVLQQCLFGLHLLNDNEEKKTICVVESEKTALIMSMLLPSYLWMATGSKTNLKLSILKPLKNHKIIVYPDNFEFIDWSKKTKLLKYHGFNIICSSLLEGLNLNAGDDLADFILLI